MPTLPSLSDAKARLSLTTTGDDTLLTSILADAIAQAEQDTGRTFASSSNSTTTYSTDNAALLTIHDRPLVDPSRTVTWNGVTLNESGTSPNVWFLPDRRDPNITASVQLRYFGNPGHSPYAFDRNLDRPDYRAGAPNDLVITGIKGHPFPSQDVVGGILTLVQFLYWKAKAGGSGQVTSPTGEIVDLAELDVLYARWVERWRIRTAVAGV